MSRFWKAVISWGGNIGFLVCAIAGLVYEVEGALNLFLAYVWFGFAVSLMTLSKDVKKSVEQVARQGRIVPTPISVSLDLAEMFLLFWFGYWWSGAAWLIHILLTESAYREAREKLELTDALVDGVAEQLAEASK